MRIIFIMRFFNQDLHYNVIDDSLVLSRYEISLFNMCTNECTEYTEQNKKICNKSLQELEGESVDLSAPLCTNSMYSTFVGMNNEIGLSPANFKRGRHLFLFFQDIFAGGNCHDAEEYKNYFLFCPYAYKLPDGETMLAKDLAVEYKYLSNTSEWFFNARKRAEEVIEKADSLKTGKNDDDDLITKADYRLLNCRFIRAIDLLN